MRRRDLLRGLFVVAVTIAAPPLHADPVDDVTRQLRAQGFEVREVSRTWLGRIRVVAESDTLQREIVFDRTTGEIRRDLMTEKSPLRSDRGEDRSTHGSDSFGRGNGTASRGGNSGGGKGGQDDDDHDDDDDDDDDNDDDSSGRGGGDDDDDSDDDSSGRGGGRDDDDDDSDDDDDDS